MKSPNTVRARLRIAREVDIADAEAPAPQHGIEHPERLSRRVLEDE